ncbi:ABC transporter permease subunit [Streptomyces massasporeus]|uniref:ABC transporter permease subunit n=1 Tax=Streptomyces massasporeus TaxID=67324 RepID=UPI00340F25F3
MDFSAILSDALRSGIGPIAAVYALAAMGLNLHFGYTGLLNFGQVGFMLVGGYGLAITVSTYDGPMWLVSTYDGPMWLGVLGGVACAIVLALLLGLPTLRLRDDYLAITTIAAGETLRLFYRSSRTHSKSGKGMKRTLFRLIVLLASALRSPLGSRRALIMSGDAA